MSARTIALVAVLGLGVAAMGGAAMIMMQGGASSAPTLVAGLDPDPATPQAAEATEVAAKPAWYKRFFGNSGSAQPDADPQASSSDGEQRSVVINRLSGGAGCGGGTFCQVKGDSGAD